MRHPNLIKTYPISFRSHKPAKKLLADSNFALPSLSAFQLEALESWTHGPSPNGRAGPPMLGPSSSASQPPAPIASISRHGDGCAQREVSGNNKTHDLRVKSSEFRLTLLVEIVLDLSGPAGSIRCLHNRTRKGGTIE